jgi:V/A-type H+/Na+-transporting ATPase subunit I
MALFFPVFVGLMVGDVGYGLVMLALLWLARRRWVSSVLLRTITPVAVLAGISTVVFGVLFGEWFGSAGHHLLGIEPLLFDRAEALITFMLIAIAIGVGQVAIGLLLGIVNALLQGRRSEAAGRVGLLVVLFAALVLLGALAGLIPPSGGQLALAALLVALVVLVASLGVAGPIEAIGVLGAVLSYARLMAIGMASVMLALVANTLGGVAGNLIVGLLVAALLHGVNVVLGFFDATIQGLRLHYVEFFSRFVEPGGTRYEPFTSVLGGIALERAEHQPAAQGGT